MDADGSNESDRLSTGGSADYNALFGEPQEKEQKFMQKTVLGEVRNVKRFGVLEWIFLIVATVSILGVLALTIERFVYFGQHFVNISIENSSGEYFAPCSNVICTSDFTFAIIVLLNIAFCAFYCYDGLLRERQFEMLGFVIAALVILVYIIANYGSSGYESQPIRLVRLVLVIVGAPINIALALLVCWRMGYLAFNIIGSNSRLIWAYKLRSLFLTLQHFHYQVLVNVFALGWARNGEFLSLAEKIILIILLVYILLVMFMGWAAVMYEIRWLSVLWHIFFAPILAYYVYKIVDVSVEWNAYDPGYIHYTNRGGNANAFHYVSAALIVACAIGILVFTLLVILMIVVLINFDKGLKDKVRPPFHREWTKVVWWFAKRKGAAKM